MHVPRLLYKGPADQTASTKRCETEADVTAALADGWRMTRAQSAPAPSSESEPADDVIPRRKGRRG